MTPAGVLIVCPDSPYSGVGRYTKSLSEALCSHSEVLYLVFSSSMSPLYEKNHLGKIVPGVSLGAGPLDSLFNQYFSQFVFYREFSRMAELRRGGWIIHFTNGIKLPMLNYHDKVVTIHDVIPYKRPEHPHQSLQRHIFRLLKLYKHYSNVIVDSNHVKKDMEAIGFDVTPTVVYPCVSRQFKPLGDKVQLRRQLGLPLKKSLILSVAPNVPRKNLKVVREAVGALGTDFSLVSVGASIPGAFTFKAVSDEVLNRIYNACDVLLFPSLDEGFGYPPIEAYSAGLPVVASDIEIFQETLGNSAILVEPTVNGCIRGIKDALACGQYPLRKGAALPRKYSPEEFAQNIRAFYENVVAKR